jgi:hypothetical protein
MIEHWNIIKFVGNAHTVALTSNTIKMYEIKLKNKKNYTFFFFVKLMARCNYT